MPNVFKDLYDKAEELKGKSFVYVSVGIMVVSLILGIFIQNLTNRVLNNSESVEIVEANIDDNIQKKVSYTGKPVYIDPRLNPGDKISYVLVDDQNNDIIYLSADDEKISLVEGLHVTLFGEVMISDASGKEILFVERIIVKKDSK